MKTTGELFEELVSIMARLRHPQNGCPWDREQNHASLKPYVIEEAYEVVDAIDNHPSKLAEELGDLMLQVVFHAQLASEEKTFDINTVISAICEKLIRRHPHVFGDVKVDGSSEVLKNWEQIKQTELEKDKSILDGVPKNLPALMRAQRIGEKAARVGFDWQNTKSVSTKVFEEIKEFLDEHEKCQDTAADEGKNELSAEAKEEFGDILFALVQWSRKAGLNAEGILSQSCDKFSSRFKQMEKTSLKPLKDLNENELEDLWDEVKLRIKSSAKFK